MRRTDFFSFFTFISYTFGARVTTYLKQWINYNRELIKLSIRIKYLLHCKKIKFLPSHLNNKRFSGFTFYNDTSKHKADIFINMFTYRMLNLEITDSFRQRKTLISRIYNVCRSIEGSLPWYICDRFFKTQCISLDKLYAHEYNILIKKIKMVRVKAEDRGRKIDRQN